MVRAQLNRLPKNVSHYKMSRLEATFPTHKLRKRVLFCTKVYLARINAKMNGLIAAAVCGLLALQVVDACLWSQGIHCIPATDNNEGWECPKEVFKPHVQNPKCTQEVS